MEILLDGIVAFLAAVGLTAVIWLLADRLVQRRAPVMPGMLVLPLRGTAEEVEWAVYRACRLRRELGEPTVLVLLDCGLEETSRRRAEVLAGNNERMTVLVPSQLEEFIT